MSRICNDLVKPNPRQQQVQQVNPAAETEEQTTIQAFCQPTLHDTWRPNLCTKDQENPRDGIFVHEPRSKGPRVAIMIYTEPTGPASRSPTSQFSIGNNT